MKPQIVHMDFNKESVPLPVRRKGVTFVISNVDSKPDYVAVQMSACSKKDHYTKKVGVRTALAAPSSVVPVSTLPYVMSEMMWDTCVKNKNDRLFVRSYVPPKLRYIQYRVTRELLKDAVGRSA